jgi:hypothetical protein
MKSASGKHQLCNDTNFVLQSAHRPKHSTKSIHVLETLKYRWNFDISTCSSLNICITSGSAWLYKLAHRFMRYICRMLCAVVRRRLGYEFIIFYCAYCGAQGLAVGTNDAVCQRTGRWIRYHWPSNRSADIHGSRTGSRNGVHSVNRAASASVVP